MARSIKADHDVWRATFGSTTDLRADANGDGHVDAADYVVWRDRTDLGRAALVEAVWTQPRPLSVQKGRPDVHSRLE